MKFHFTESKLRKQPFLLKFNSKCHSSKCRGAKAIGVARGGKGAHAPPEIFRKYGHFVL